MNYRVCHDKFNLLERPASKVVGLTYQWGGSLFIRVNEGLDNSLTG